MSYTVACAAYQWPHYALPHSLALRRGREPATLGNKRGGMVWGGSPVLWVLCVGDSTEMAEAPGCSGVLDPDRSGPPPALCRAGFPDAARTEHSCGRSDGSADI